MNDMLRTSLVLEHNELLVIDQSLPITRFANRDVLFGEALTLYIWTVGQIRKERIIAAINVYTDRYEQLPMPPLDQTVPPGSVLTATDGGSRLTRIFVRVPCETVERMDKRKDIFGYSSRADMLDRCKTVYLAAFEACRNRSQFASIDTKTGERTLTGYPFLNRALHHYTH
jgi:hypothetical protein